MNVTYTPYVIGEICRRISEGDTVANICRDDDMPNRSAVFQWLNKYPEFVKMYRQACETRAEAWVDDILDISDDQDEDVNRSRVKIDSRKWIMKQHSPRRYGDKVDITADVKTSEKPDISKLTDSEKDVLLLLLEKSKPE